MPPASDYMADHLDGLAEGLTGAIPPADTEVKRAMLRGIANLSRGVNKVERDMQRMEGRLHAVEQRIADHDALERRIESLETKLLSAESSVKAGWWVAVKVAAVLSFGAGAAWTLYQHFNNKV